MPHDMTWSEIGSLLQENLQQSLSLGSPFHPWYLASALLLTGMWLMHSQRWSVGQALVYLRQQFWQNRQFLWRDGAWALLQIIFLRVPIAALHVYLFKWSYDLSLEWGRSIDSELVAPPEVEAFLASLLTMLMIDLAAYGVHRALHASPWLWWIHRVHHQTRFLSPLSTLRQHPLEPFLLNGARGLGAGLSLGILHLLLPNATPVWTIQGMGVGFFLYMFTVNLHHAPIPLRYPAWLRCILISPHIHHIHHSRASDHHGKNFGVVFSLWDQLFGSYWDQDFGLNELEFGVEG